MNQDGATQMSTSGTTNYISTNFNSATKYDGLIQQSNIKIIRNMLFSFLSYMDSIVKIYSPLHIVVSVWRLLQLFGPSLCASYIINNKNNRNSSDDIIFLWKKGIPRNVIGIFSILFHIIPSFVREKCSNIINIVFISLSIIIFIIWIGSSLYLRKTAKLPNALVIFINLMLSSFLSIVSPIMLNLAGESISRVIWGGENNKNQDFNIVGSIIIPVISIIVSIFIYLIFQTLICVSLIFRPTSLQSILPHPQNEINLYTYLVTFLMAIGSQLSKIPRLIVMFLSIIVYAFSIRVPFLPGTIINITYRKTFLAISISSIINILILAILSILDNQANQIFIFVIVAVFIVSYIASHFIFQKYITLKLEMLDQIIDDNTYIDTYVETPNKMATLICTSMQYAHSAMSNWDLFKVATEKWPKSTIIWILYAKFVAIYPEETNVLSYIIRSIVSQKLKGFTIKQIVAQTGSIQIQRECTLTSDLKHKMKEITKTVTQTKTKLRHIWDIVIQGNIGEMEPAIDAGYHSVNQCKNDFLHLISQYPNNRFVSRSYSRFILEVLGDRDGFNEWKEKTNSLKNGVIITEDLTYKLGMEAFPMTFDHISQQNMILSNIGAESETMTGLEVELGENEGNQNNFEQSRMIMEKINNISIPSLNFAIIWTIILFLLTFIVVPVAIIINSNNFIEHIEIPLNFLYHMAMIKNYNFMIPLWVHHFVFESITSMNGPFEHPNYTGLNMKAFGNIIDPLNQCKYICEQCAKSLEELTQFHTYKKGNPLLGKAREILYDPIVEHRYYYFENESFKYNSMNMSLQAIMMNNIVLINQFLGSNFSDQTIFQRAFMTPNCLNSFMSAHILNDNISTILNSALNYIEILSQQVDVHYMTYTIAISITAGILFIISLVIIIIFIGQNKQAIYKCLIALPKNVVSSVSESLRILKNESDESSRTSQDQNNEDSKQEDSIMKLFATAADSSSSLSAETVSIIFVYLFYTAFAVLICYICLDFLPNIARSLHLNSPHIIYTLGISSSMMGIEVSLNDAIVGSKGYGPASTAHSCIARIPTIDVFNRLLTYVDDFFLSYHIVKYGSEDNSIKPYDKFNEIMGSLDISKFCKGDLNEIKTNKEAVDCINYEFQVMMFYNLMMKIAIPYITEYNKGSPIIIEPSSELVTTIWYLVVKLYTEVFFRMFDEIIPSTNEKMNNVISSNLPYLIILIIAGFITVLLFILICFTIRKKLVFSLSLLLNCNPVVVASTTKTMDVINGHFSSETKDLTLRDKIYYDSILMEIPNAVIVADQNYKLIQSNKAFEIIFGKYELSNGDDIKQFFKNDKIFIRNEAFENFTITNNHECILMAKQEGESIIHLQTNVHTIGSNISITMSDVSQIVSYNKLIKEEKAKSDKLLASILPPNLVARVQAGEKKISFAVPSASILFMDIVEFTPWCASGTAADVMSTLNLLYRYFDMSLAQGKTLTKIKCIGDCYMAAGGIFSELYQPSVHAKECVEFGLAAIDDVKQLNQEKNEQLQIRVGVNTGGPIVAGVLGTEKPTFEILGPAINMAQQMEHHGVPMKVHISRSVYELIYGGPIKIVERGQIEIKKGKVVTYLVEGKSD